MRENPALRRSLRREVGVPVMAAARALAERQLRLASDKECEFFSPGWSPKTAAQKAALDSTADILFFGGAAGSLKTETILVDAIRERNNPNLRAIIFRQQFTHMTDIVEKTHRLYIPLGAGFVGAPNWMWTFPSGATVRLAYISCDKDVWEYLGPRYTFIAFDESTMHTEYQIRNMLGRLSATDRNLNLRVRLASNPGNVGAAWHKKMLLRGACPVHQGRKSPSAFLIAQSLQVRLGSQGLGVSGSFAKCGLA